MMPESIHLIDISLIDPNPHEPRQTINDKVVNSIADSVFGNRLSQPIQLRPRDGRYQTAYGQLRILAFRKLHALRWKTDTTGQAKPDPEIVNLYLEDGRTTRIPAIVREMTDVELMRSSLSENALREPLPWMDETKAIQRAIDLGLSQRQVAHMLGISPPNVNQRVQILRMPDSIHSLIREDRLAWTSARLLLPFVANSHVHERELEACASYLYEQEGQITRSNVDHAADLVLGSFRDTWRRLRAGGRPWIVWPDCFHGEPMFDIDTFEAENADHIHTFTLQDHQDVWTCNAHAWDAQQNRAYEEGRRLFVAQQEADATQVEEREDPAPVAYDDDSDLLEPEFDASNQDRPWSAEPRDVSTGNTGEAAEDVSTGNIGDAADAIWRKPVRIPAQCYPFTMSPMRSHWHVEWATRFDRQSRTHKSQSPAFATFEEAQMFVEDASWRNDEGLYVWFVEHRFSQVAS